MVWEVLKGFKRETEDLGRSRRIWLCLEDLVISVRVWEDSEGSEVSRREDMDRLRTLLDPHKPFWILQDTQGPLQISRPFQILLEPLGLSRILHDLPPPHWALEPREVIQVPNLEHFKNGLKL